MLPRMLYLVEGLYPQCCAGTEKHAYELSQALALKGLPLKVITRQLKKGAAEKELIGKVLVQRIRPEGVFRGTGWKALGPMLLLFFRVFFILLINARKYDVMLISGLKTLPIPCLLANILIRKITILRAESPSDLGEDICPASLSRMNISNSFLLLKLLRQFRCRLIQKADLIVAISSEIKDQLLGAGVKPEKIRLLPNGIDTNKFCPVSDSQKKSLRSRLSISDDTVLFIFVGRIVKSKGIPVLIRAWNEIYKKYPGVKLLLVGSGSYSFDNYEHEVKKFIEDNSLRESVLMVDEVDDVDRYLKASDVFVFPSEYEGFPLATMEAMACGLPVIMTNVGGSQLIDSYRNGIVIERNSREELQKAIEWILNHPSDMLKMGMNARNTISSYSMDNLADKYISMSKSLVDQRDNGALPE